MATIALVGRPNVGKSTLFNRLTKRRDALVADIPGLTRDRRYGRAVLSTTSCTLIDTGGVQGVNDELTALMTGQVEQAITESDHVLFVVDARDGLTPGDHEIVAGLRRHGVDFTLVINKIDGVDELITSEFASLGIAHVHSVSASHGKGVASLCEAIEAQLPEEVASPSLANSGIRVAIVGRPNVGKSTLVNRLLGEERQVVFDAPGTTRDAIEIPFERDEQKYTLIDTAGVRRKGRVDGTIEKFSVIKSLEAMSNAQVAILVLDASEGLVDQDLHLLSYALDAGCGILIALNKWDGLDADVRQTAKVSLDRKLRFAPWISIATISALHGTGVGKLMTQVNALYKTSEFDVTTSELTRLLEQAVATHPTPAVNGRVIKLRFAHKAGSHPPRIVIHGNQTDKLPASYQKYLENFYRKALNLHGTPIKIEYKTGTNPYKNKKNKLTERQVSRRNRVIKHRKKK